MVTARNLLLVLIAASVAGLAGTLGAHVALGEPEVGPAEEHQGAGRDARDQREHPEALVRGERAEPSEDPIYETWEDDYFPFLGFEPEVADKAAVLASGPAGRRQLPLGDMVDIPAGFFVFGDDRIPGSRPRRKVHLPAYRIDRYEVTNLQYRDFIRATKRRAPYVHENWAAVYNWYEDTFPPGRDELPVILVTWKDADAYCRWSKKRLPTEQEWEKAARGAVDDRAYPWGNVWDSRKANVVSRLSGPLTSVAQWDAFEAAWTGSKKPEIFPVGSYPADSSPFGVMDVQGNVSEWVAGTFEAREGGPPNDRVGYGQGLRVARGNSWGNRDYSTPLSIRYPYEEDRVDSVIGFRCAADP